MCPVALARKGSIDLVSSTVLIWSMWCCTPLESNSHARVQSESHSITRRYKHTAGNESELFQL